WPPPPTPFSPFRLARQRPCDTQRRTASATRALAHNPHTKTQTERSADEPPRLPPAGLARKEPRVPPLARRPPLTKFRYPMPVLSAERPSLDLARPCQSLDDSGWMLL